MINIDITVVDDNLLRIAGTGDFQSRLNESSPRNSIFSNIIENGIQEAVIYEKDDTSCFRCYYKTKCRERNSIIYPIMGDGTIIGLTCFATFNITQDKFLLEKKLEYIEVLKRFTKIIEDNIKNIKTINTLNSNTVEINTLINSIDKEIIIINSTGEITNINNRAIHSLDLNISKSNIINKPINSIINNIDLNVSENKEIKHIWISFGKTFEVIYKINYAVLDQNSISTIINFSIINNNKNQIHINNNYLYAFDRIIGENKKIRNAIHMAKVASKSNSTVILYGESGTGKELFAKGIHEYSNRPGALVSLNCSAIPDNLIESELFGYEKGSFTGADKNGKIGKIELANNGTLFLDEIGDMPLQAQAKLLRVLQERKIDKIGGIKPIDLNVKIIAATNKNLYDMVVNKQFREDLFYRINVIPINIPPLREREDDILLISRYIINNICREIHCETKMLSNEVIDIFLNYNWPGNIRQLENVLEYAVLFSDSKTIHINDLPEYFLYDSLNSKEQKNINIVDFQVDIGKNNDLEDMKRNFEKYILEKYINYYGDTLKGKEIISEKLNISISTLYRKLNDMK